MPTLPCPRPSPTLPCPRCLAHAALPTLHYPRCLAHAVPSLCYLAHAALPTRNHTPQTSNSKGQFHSHTLTLSTQAQSEHPIASHLVHGLMIGCVRVRSLRSARPSPHRTATAGVSVGVAVGAVAIGLPTNFPLSRPTRLSAITSSSRPTSDLTNRDETRWIARPDWTTKSHEHACHRLI